MFPLSIPARLIMPLIGALLALGLVAGVVLYIHALQGDVAKARAQAAANHAAAVVAAGQAAAGQAAGQVADAGAQRDAATVSTHGENAHAIAATPGASVPLDPRLNAGGRRGLCKFDAYAGEAACAGLRGAYPAVLPRADSGNRDPGR